MKKSLITCFLFLVGGFWLNSTAPASKYKVKKGDTLYSISRQYGLKLNDILKANPGLTAKSNVRIGQYLLVPTKNQKPETISYKPVSVPSTPDTPWREEDIRPRAVMTERAKAVVAEEKIMPKPPVVVTDGLRTSSGNAAEYPVIFDRYASHGYKIKRNKGAANYLDEATSGNQNLAFYSHAETGSVIRVTNLLNHKTVFVKVIGKVPPVDAGSDITVKLSSKAAQDLGAVDEKFLVEVASFSAN